MLLWPQKGMLNIAMIKRLLAALCVCLVLSAACFAQQDVAAAASRLTQGQFKQAATLLSTALQDKSLPAAERDKLAFELDRLDRIKQDFPLTKEALFTDLRTRSRASAQRNTSGGLKKAASITGT